MGSPVLASKRSRGGVAFALGVALLLACGDSNHKKDDNNFREDVIECEDAVAKLQRCCAGFDPTDVLCQYYYEYQSGCGDSQTDSVKPVFTTAESACIRSAPCEQLVATRVCDRAQKARAYEYHASTSTEVGSSTTTTDASTVTHLPVCP